MEEVICDLCGTDKPTLLFNRVDRYTGQEFQLATCSICGLIYMPTRPAAGELDKYYPEDYEAYYLLDEKSDSRNWHLRRALDLQLKFVETHSLGKGKLLDVGSATGNFLKVAQENGWQVLGIEPIVKAAKIAREYYHLEITTSTLETAPLEPGTFDVITMWDVLEHLPSPKQALIRSRELLEPGGILVFSIPNLSSFDRYLFGKYWIGWDAPRHFNLFTEQALDQLLEATGFEKIAKSCILGGKGTFLLSLDNMLGDNRFSSIIKTLYPIISALLWPYRQISYLIKRGPIITYAVRKPIKD